MIFILHVTNIKQVLIAIGFCKFVQQHWLFNGRKVAAQNVHTFEIILHRSLTALRLWFSLGLSYFVCWFLELKPLDLSYLPNFAQIGFGIFDIWCLCWDWFCHIWGGGAGVQRTFCWEGREADHMHQMLQCWWKKSVNKVFFFR